MMIGFAGFAMIPSLLWLFLPLWFNNVVPTSQQYTPSISSSSSDIGDGESVSVTSLLILILCGLVWCLGVWKSRFVDSNWVVFGLETIAVLIVCISSAYGVASLFVYCLGLDSFFNDMMPSEDNWSLATLSPNADL